MILTIVLVALIIVWAAIAVRLIIKNRKQAKKSGVPAGCCSCSAMKNSSCSACFCSCSSSSEKVSSERDSFMENGKCEGKKPDLSKTEFC